jgi:ubiquinone biosynthesis accessory factor UbiK
MPRMGPTRLDWGLAFYPRLRYHDAMPTESIDKLARKLSEAVPEGLKSVRDDLEQNFRSILRSGLSRLDLVTREEFDVQQAVLARTREKLTALEQRLQTLEGESAAQAGPAYSGSTKGGSAGKKPG